jgi:hypothetical protein
VADQIEAVQAAPSPFIYDRDASTYRHWQVSIDGRIATVTMNVDPDGGLVPGYKLKPNSYDLGVDMELYDIVQRLSNDAAHRRNLCRFRPISSPHPHSSAAQPPAHYKAPQNAPSVSPPSMSDLTTSGASCRKQITQNTKSDI